MTIAEPPPDTRAEVVEPAVARADEPVVIKCSGRVLKPNPRYKDYMV